MNVEPSGAAGGTMKGQVSRRGDARAEYRAALAEKDNVPRSVRHLFHRALVDMDGAKTALSSLCLPIAGREGLFAFGCLVSGMGSAPSALGPQ